MKVNIHATKFFQDECPSVQVSWAVSQEFIEDCKKYELYDMLGRALIAEIIKQADEAEYQEMQ